MATILSGIPLRDKIREQLTKLVSSLSPENIPSLSIIQIGSNDSSSLYVKHKISFGKSIGIPVQLHHLPDDAMEEQVIDLILNLNANPSTGGIIVQLPLPVHISQHKVIEAIDPKKDVDGLHSVNMKKLLIGDPSGIIPATTRGILSLLYSHNITLEGKHVLMIGRSALVGKPTALACLNENATVTVAHHKSSDLKGLCKAADIIIVATGVPGLITKSHVLKKHIIIDVGITKQGGIIAGDVFFEEVSAIVEALSPVPGGIGPLTVASLFQNLLRNC